MKSFLDALQQVSSLDFHVQAPKTVMPWLLVLARAVLALLCGVAGGLILWLVPNDRIVGGLLATLAVVFLRVRLAPVGERSGVVEAAGLFCPKDVEARTEASYRQVVFQVLLALRPLCIFVLLLHRNWLWLAASAALATAVSMESEKARPTGLHWLAALAVALLSGAFSSKLFANQSGMFIMSLVATALCWLLPAMLERLGLKGSRHLWFYLGETTALLLGLLGQAW